MLARWWILLGCAPGVWASWTDTSTGIDLNKLPHPALTKIRAGVLKPRERVRFDGITAMATVDEVVLTGKAWSVRMCASCFDEVWRADLDANGTADYVIFGAGPYEEGRTTPLYSMSFLLMDSGGLPLPFFTGVFRGENGDAIKHLVNWEGQIRLLISRYDEIPSNGSVAPYCSGHWVTQLYGFTKGAVEEVRKTVGGFRFPYVRNWTYSGPECENHPAGFTAPANIFEIRTTAKDVVAELPECESIKADAVLYDTLTLREIAFPNLRGDAQQQLMEQMATRELRGTYRCNVTLMWATPARPNP